MALENNWQQKSIENLERDFWGDPPKDSTSLVENVHRLRALPIEKLNYGDIRLLIGQNVGLKYLVPLVIDILEGDIFFEADFYEGDMLQNTLNIDEKFWVENSDLKGRLNYLLKDFSEEEINNFKKGKF
ncbi:MAG: contact-dependent growth inhibition system immunity protein [Fulvivirga sp.]